MMKKYLLVCLLLTGCGEPKSESKSSKTVSIQQQSETVAAHNAANSASLRMKIVQAARSQIGKTVRYDPAYTALAYPMGDVPLEKGVCTDVIIRALREQGIDLQVWVHEDMCRNFDVYPKRWGLKRPDPNIDHRRVPNLETFFTRQGWRVLRDNFNSQETQFQAGDIVTWVLNGNRLPHIGIVSDRKKGHTPLIIHNIGAGTQEEDILFKHQITGHFRLPENLPDKYRE